MLKVLLIDNGSRLLPQLQQMLRDFAVDTIPHADLPQVTKSYDLVVFSGGYRYSIIDNPEMYEPLTKFIRSYQKPLIGVCLGAQLLAYAYGGKLERLEEYVNGVLELEKLKEHELFANVEPLSVYENHVWVIKELPEEI